MADHATSADPGVQLQLDRLARITPGRDLLGRARLRTLLARLGHPERALPPVFHVAGTNGKGSTCTYLRGAFAAAGLRAHVYTSPHLVRLNERIRIANRLIDDAALATVLGEVIELAEGTGITFFEAITAAAFLAFAREPADACIVEVGIGGRLDATNVLPTAAVCGIAQLSLEHQEYLGTTIEAIAGEKAGIAKPGVPLVTRSYPPAVAARVAEVAAAAGAPLFVEGREWTVESDPSGLSYADANGTLTLAAPALAGAHQIGNAGLAIAMLRRQDAVAIDAGALSRALATARWPARLARLMPGPFVDLLPAGATVWLDGAHNPAAMAAVVAFLRDRLPPTGRLPVIIGMLRDKDLAEVLGQFAGIGARFHAVPIDGYDHHPPQRIVEVARSLGHEATAHGDLADAAAAVAREPLGRGDPVLIAGSLYLAGEVLAANGELPD